MVVETIPGWARYCFGGTMVSFSFVEDGATERKSLTKGWQAGNEALMARISVRRLLLS